MDYFSTRYLLTGHKWNKWNILKEEDSIIEIEYNPYFFIWKENGKKIHNFEKYCQDNLQWIEQSKLNYDNYCNILNFLKNEVVIPLKYNETTVELVVNNKFVELKVIVHKISQTINFYIKDKSSDTVVEKDITNEQLIGFIIKNKHIINFKENYSFIETESYSKLSNDYRKLFIKRPIEKRIYTQSCKENVFDYSKDNSLTEIQKFIRLNLQSINLN
jgi:hypothetical protein